MRDGGELASNSFRFNNGFVILVFIIQNNLSQGPNVMGLRMDQFSLLDTSMPKIWILVKGKQTYYLSMLKKNKIGKSY